MSDPPRVLVVGPAWVGDMVMAHGLFQILHRRQPRPCLDVLAPAWSQPLLARMPEVAHAIESPTGHGQLALGARRRLGLELRAMGHAQAILLPNSWKSALVPFWARIPQRTGWRGEWRYGLLNDIRHLDRQRLPTTVQRFVALGLPAQAPPPDLADLPRPRLTVNGDAARAALERFSLPDPLERPPLALCPGAEFGSSKRWPAPHYGRLAQLAHRRGWAVWLFGSAQDRPVCAAVNESSGGVCLDLAGRTSLAEAVDLLSLAERVVSNDSGLMHVAAALDRPLVALFGSTDPAHTPPLSPRARVLRRALPCAPCFRRECPLGHLDCLAGLSVEQVLEALDTLENLTPGPAS